jgi:hypothetical protein
MREFINKWKLNNELLKKLSGQRGNWKENLKICMDEKRPPAHKNLKDEANTVLRRKFIPTNTYTKKKKKSQVS